MAGLLTFGSIYSPHLPGPDLASYIRRYSIIAICYLIKKRPSNNRPQWIYFIIRSSFTNNEKPITDNEIGGFCPRTQRRVRTGVTPVSLLSLKLFINYHLLPDSCVTIRFKILTYYRVGSAFEANCVLLSNKIWQFQNSFTN